MKINEKAGTVQDYADKRTKKKTIKHKKPAAVRFDKDALLLAWGMMVVFVGLGTLIIWATMTVPEGASGSIGYTLAQRLARVLPQSVQAKMAFFMGGLMVAFGVVCFFLGLNKIVQFTIKKYSNNSRS